MRLSDGRRWTHATRRGQVLFSLLYGASGCYLGQVMLQANGTWAWDNELSDECGEGLSRREAMAALRLATTPNDHVPTHAP